MIPSRQERYIATLLVAIACKLSASADDALTNQFLQEAPRKWNEYASLLRGFDLSGEHTTEFVPLDTKGKGEKQTQHEADEVIVDASGKNAFMKRGPDIYGSNEDYYF